jgi:hemoglobin
MIEDNLSVYELVGGDAVFLELVERFYSKVEADTLLRPIFPPDLEPGKRYQYLFLVQVFGGPAAYAQERGHPRMRARHLPFPINQEARDRWLAYMFEAIDEVAIVEPARGLMREYFERASAFMVNSELETDHLLKWQPPKGSSE